MRTVGGALNDAIRMTGNAHRCLVIAAVQLDTARELVGLSEPLEEALALAPVIQDVDAAIEGLQCLATEYQAKVAREFA